MDRKIAQEVYNCSSFIELHPTAHKIWAVNSLRQLFLCTSESFKELMDSTQSRQVQLVFEPVNNVFNVMKACMGDRHQVVIKIVKQLDTMMMRDINVPPMLELYQPEPPLDFLDIPKPTFATSSDFDGSAEETPTREEASLEDYIPSLSDHCVKVLSENLSVDNALDLLENSDMQQMEELKINTLKFIALNIVSFLEGTSLERIYKLPVYLIRELENFLKAENIDKFSYQSMNQLDLLVEESISRDNLKQPLQQSISST